MINHYHDINPNARPKHIVTNASHPCWLPNLDAPEVFVALGSTLVLVPPKMSSVEEPDVVTTTGVPLMVTTCPILAVMLPPMITSGFPEMVVGTALSVVATLLAVDTTVDAVVAVVDGPALFDVDPMTLVDGGEPPVPEKTISVTEPDVTTCPT